MKTQLLCFALLSLCSCSGSQTSGRYFPASQASNRTGTPDAHGLATPNPDGVLLVATGSPADAPQGGPAHVFTPKAHAAHHRPAPAFVPVSALPRLVVRTQSCYGQDSEGSVPFINAPRGHSPQAGSIGLSGSGSQGFGAGSGNLARSKAPARSPAKRPMAAPQKSAPSTPAPAAAPAPPAAEASQGDGYEYSFDDKAGPLRAPVPPREQAKAKKEAPSGADSRRDSAAEPADEAWTEAASEPERGSYHAWGASLFLSNDDSMSLSSAQRVIYAIDRFLPIPQEHVRPHELLNYFSFDTAALTPGNDFSVSAELQPKPAEPGNYTLGLSVAGRDLSREQRRNAALTFVIDRSGSMSDEGRMDYLKRGLQRMTSELKSGDLVHLVLFDDEVCVPVENFVVGRDSMSVLTQAISRMQPRGSTDVHLGLQRGYTVANQSYQATHSNRVLLITDALANTGVTDSETLSLIAQHYDARRIRLSGVGVGSEFNDALLDRMTERGRGAYVFLGSEAEVDAVFGARFTSLIETVANDVHFQLHLPPSLGMNVFYGEESSTQKSDVLPIHYFAGTSQLFLSDLAARGGQLRPQDSAMLSVTYEDPETGERREEEFAFNLGQISQRTRNVQKARLILSFIDGVKDTTQSHPEQTNYQRGGWVDGYAATQCSRGRASLENQARTLQGDAEVKRVLGLWETYCSRYAPAEAPRSPVRRPAPQGQDVWPSAG